MSGETDVPIAIKVASARIGQQDGHDADGEQPQRLWEPPQVLTEQAEIIGLEEGD